jgi:hypothetical protein
MRKPTFYITALILFVIAIVIGCRQAYEPVIIKANKNYLVVEGSINAGTQAVTTILLSRTRNVTDSIFSIPELNAQVSIASSNGNYYQLHDQGNGKYVSDELTLNTAAQYQLQIITADNSRYVSDFVAVKQTPDIDSIHWIYTPGSGVTLFANTHDPQNNTRYYRWEYVETWEYHATFNAGLSVDNGLMYYDVPYNHNYICYHTINSTDILLGSSVNLAQDVISNDSITTIPQDNPKIGVRYSILLKQYALSQEGYQYWELLQKNTQQLGSLFDAQPSQLTGNIQCINNPVEPVIGYIDASTVTVQRLFIDNHDVSGWQKEFPYVFCDTKTISRNPNNFLIYDYADTSYAPYYFTGVAGLVIAKKACVDCTWFGGTNVKPSFW